MCLCDTQIQQKLALSAHFDAIFLCETNESLLCFLGYLVVAYVCVCDFKGRLATITFFWL